MDAPLPISRSRPRARDRSSTVTRRGRTFGLGRLLAAIGASVAALASLRSIADAPTAPPAEARFRDGDLVFQESTSAQAAAIREVTGSRFTHMGLVFRRAGGWQVLEAVGPVKYTPYETWAARGRGGEVAQRRLRDADRRLDVAGTARLRREAERMLGSPYDRVFASDDRAIYCSELAFDAYERALGIRIGEPQPWTALDLDGPEARRLVRRRLRGRAPIGTVITPVRMMESELLVPVE